MAKIRRYPLGTFMKRFSTEDQCQEYLASLRWKSGYVCPKLAAATHTGWPTDGINVPSAVTRFR